MNRRAWIAFALPMALVATALAPAALAQEPQAQAADVGTTTIRVGVIDGERVIAESNIGQDVRQRAEELSQQLQAQINTKRQEVNSLIQQAQEQAVTLNQDAMQRLQEQIDQGQVELQRMNEDAQRQLARYADQAQMEINNQLIPAVERMASEQNLDLILDTRIEGILFFSDAIDLTDEFIVMVNAGTGGDGQGEGSR